MEVKGFIELPVKQYIISQEKLDEIKRLDSLGISKSENLYDDNYMFDKVIYVRPEEIKCFEESNDGFVHVAIYDAYSFQKVCMNIEEFINKINSL